jgi:hypothetical protein
MDNSVLLTTVAIAALIYIDPDWDANPALNERLMWLSPDR